MTTDQAFERDLLSRLVAVETKLEVFIEEFRSERTASQEHRRNLSIVIASMTGSVQALTQQVADMKPHVEQSQIRWAEALGATKFGRFVWGALVAMAGLVGGLISWAINWKPPAH